MILVTVDRHRLLLESAGMIKQVYFLLNCIMRQSQTFYYKGKWLYSHGEEKNIKHKNSDDDTSIGLFMTLIDIKTPRPKSGSTKM